MPDEQLENGAAEVDVHVTASNCACSAGRSRPRAGD